MNGFEKAMYMLPERMRQPFKEFSDCMAEEVRLRSGQIPTVFYAGEEHNLNCTAVSAEEIFRIVEKITGASIHSSAAEICEGYINCMGLRIGICGKAVLSGGQIRGFTDFSSLAVRIPRECRGICDSLIDEIYIKGFKNTLLISKPGGGKTTALREIIRKLSDSGIRIGVADERNELAAAEGPDFQFDLGCHTDALVSVPKAEAAMMLLRGMNEEIIAMDEISSPKDISAVSQIYGCGVGILATAHASDTDELLRRPLYHRLIDMNIFRYIVTIESSSSKRRFTAERI